MDVLRLTAANNEDVETILLFRTCGPHSAVYLLGIWRKNKYDGAYVSCAFTSKSMEQLGTEGKELFCNSHKCSKHSISDVSPTSPFNKRTAILIMDSVSWRLSSR